MSTENYLQPATGWLKDGNVHPFYANASLEHVLPELDLAQLVVRNFSLSFSFFYIISSVFQFEKDVFLQIPSLNKVLSKPSQIKPLIKIVGIASIALILQILESSMATLSF